MTTIQPTQAAALAGRTFILDLQRAALFLDLDGTLAPIAATPGAVGPDPSRSRLLEQLAGRLGGRVAVISGRTVEAVDHILEGRIVPVAGVHGLQRRTADGVMSAAEPHGQLALARDSLRAFAAADRNLLVEDKGLSVTLHYRNAPGCADAVRELAQRLEKVTGLVLQEGHMVVELRTPGPTKGDAVAAFMAEPPFAGARPIYIGDDLTDEDAFAAVAEAGGDGVLVGPERETAATWRLENVAQVLAWLGAALETPPAGCRAASA